MLDLLVFCSENSSQIIIILAVVHFLCFLGLCGAQWDRTRKMASSLKEAIDRAGIGTSEMADLSPDDLIDSCCQDILSELKATNASSTRKNLRTQLERFNEMKPYKKTTFIETCHNISRTTVEIYPLLGILGTVMALGAGLMNVPADLMPSERKISEVPAVSSATVEIVPEAQAVQPQVEIESPGHASRAAQNILQNFGDAIFSTIWGLLFGMLFMWLHAAVELKFERLVEHRKNIAEVVMWAHKVLSPEAEHEDA
jgi:biopolymer transport protein ExbB